MRIRKRLRELGSVDEIIATVGSQWLRERLDKTPQDLTNWKAKGELPSRTYVVIKARLNQLGYTAPDRLWNMLELKRAG